MSHHFKSATFTIQNTRKIERHGFHVVKTTDAQTKIQFKLVMNTPYAHTIFLFKTATTTLQNTKQQQNKLNEIDILNYICEILSIINNYQSHQILPHLNSKLNSKLNSTRS